MPKLNTNIIFRISEEEKKTYENYCVAHNMKVSELIKASVRIYMANNK